MRSTDQRHPGDSALRPEACPFCGSKAFDTLAKVLSVTTLWRCRGCERTWSIASQAAAPRRH